MKKQHQEELLNWVKAAIKELDKLDHDRSSRVLLDSLVHCPKNHPLFHIEIQN
jgi:hypothetical protein